MSVALCTYNGERYLSEQLESIAKQTRLPDELVVCDDGSRDTTVSLLTAFAADAPFPVRVSVNERRLGVTANFEQAMTQCDGDIIVLCDQDDVWMPHRLERLDHEFGRDRDLAVAFSDAGLIDRNGQPLRWSLWDAIGLDRATRARLLRDPFGFVVGRPAMTGCTTALRSSLLPLVIPFPSEDAGSDVPLLHDMWISVAVSAATKPSRVMAIEEQLVSYRLHPGQSVGLPHLRLRRVVPMWVRRWANIRIRQRTQGARLAATVRLLDDVARRMDAVEADLGSDRVFKAARHVDARATLPRSRASRLRVVSRELREGRYHEYGGGVAAAVADLLRVS